MRHFCRYFSIIIFFCMQIYFCFGAEQLAQNSLTLSNKRAWQDRAINALLSPQLVRPEDYAVQLRRNDDEALKIALQVQGVEEEDIESRFSVIKNIVRDHLEILKKERPLPYPPIRDDRMPQIIIDAFESSLRAAGINPLNIDYRVSLLPTAAMRVVLDFEFLPNNGSKMQYCLECDLDSIPLELSRPDRALQVAYHEATHIQELHSFVRMLINCTRGKQLSVEDKNAFAGIHEITADLLPAALGDINIALFVYKGILSKAQNPYFIANDKHPDPKRTVEVSYRILEAHHRKEGLFLLPPEPSGLLSREEKQQLLQERQQRQQQQQFLQQRQQQQQQRQQFLQQQLQLLQQQRLLQEQQQNQTLWISRGFGMALGIIAFKVFSSRLKHV